MHGCYDGIVSTTPPSQRIDVGEITLAWGNPARIKAELREESTRRYQALPLGERILIVLSMVERLVPLAYVDICGVVGVGVSVEIRWRWCPPEH